jgi:hypothetical protein
MNIRSLSRYFDRLIVFLDSCNTNFDVICLYETWLAENILDYYIDRYDIYNYYSKSHKSDGISVYTKSLIQVNSIKLGKIDFCISLSIHFSRNNEVLNVCTDHQVWINNFL